MKKVTFKKKIIMKNTFIRNINNLNIYNLQEVGIKNAALGELISDVGIAQEFIPKGFAISSSAIEYILKFNKIDIMVKDTLKNIDLNNIKNLQNESKKIRDFISKKSLPHNLKSWILIYYRDLYNNGKNKVIVRSSKVEKNLFNYKVKESPGNFTNISGIDNIEKHIMLCIENLYTSAAIKERSSLNRNINDIHLSILIQKMVESDVGESGIAYSVKSKDGLNNVIVVKGCYGVGGTLNKNEAQGDEFNFNTNSLSKGKKSLINKKLGSKSLINMIDKKNNQIILKKAPTYMQERYCISEKTAHQVAVFLDKIEKFYSKKYGHKCRAEINWEFDGPQQKLFITKVKPLGIKQRRSKKKSDIIQLTNYNRNSSTKSAA